MGWVFSSLPGWVGGWVGWGGVGLFQPPWSRTIERRHEQRRPDEGPQQQRAKYLECEPEWVRLEGHVGPQAEPQTSAPGQGEVQTRKSGCPRPPARPAAARCPLGRHWLARLLGRHWLARLLGRHWLALLPLRLLAPHSPLSQMPWLARLELAIAEDGLRQLRKMCYRGKLSDRSAFGTRADLSSQRFLGTCALK